MPHKSDAVHPFPIELDVSYYENLFHPNMISHVPSGFCEVGTDESYQYIIGLIMSDRLCPFVDIVDPIADPNNGAGRVKIRIDGDYANVTVPIRNNDPLNNLFRKRFGPKYVQIAHIHE